MPLLFLGTLSAQIVQDASPLSVPAFSWAQAASVQELRIVQSAGTFPVQYTVHKTDSRGDATRVVIECRGGTVARTMLRDGKPLTAEQQADERGRLQQILDDPATWEKKQQRSLQARSYATALVKQMPAAMLYTYVPGQPQPAAAQSAKAQPQIVIDFKPNPAYQPPDMAAELLTGLEGRMWIDPQSKVLTRVEGRIVRPVNFGWGGIFARFYPGGTVVFAQSDAGDGRWIYSFVDEDVTIRELLVKTVAEKSVMRASDIHLLPRPLDVRQAVEQLLALPGPR
jgi:hypothetical protein